MQVMLSVPIPSDAARFIGHILSIIISMILAIPRPVNTYAPPLTPGEAVPLDDKPFLVGDVTLFLPEEDVEAVPLLFTGDVVDVVNVDCLLLNFPFVS